MRRIPASDASRRDDGPATADEPSASIRTRARRSATARRLSRHLVPNRLARRAISVEVSTPRREYPPDTPIPFQVTMTNRLPVPITISTRSPLSWTWSVDGLPNASRISVHDPPDEPGSLAFDRGERKRFAKRWHQSIRVSEREWERADPGEHTIGARLDVDEPLEYGLAAETTVRIVPNYDS